MMPDNCSIYWWDSVWIGDVSHTIIAVESSLENAKEKVLSDIRDITIKAIVAQEIEKQKPRILKTPTSMILEIKSSLSA